MDLSRKIILVSCIGAAFLAIGIGCTVEDRDIEAKDTFLCQSNDDCLEGSRCVITTEKQGRCWREDQISHCLDLDGDGFFKETEEQYLNECDLGEVRDPDDNDKLVYPGATEICDGKDNSNDGCVDGECSDPSGNCKDNQDACLPFIQFCNIPGDYHVIAARSNSVCAAHKLGINVCEDGDLVFKICNEPECKTMRTPNDGDAKSCPSSIELTPGYDELDSTCDKIDGNCNGSVDEGCTECKVKHPVCYVSTNGVKEVEESDGNFTYLLNDVCGGDKAGCPCIGESQCLNSSDAEISCIKNGSPIDSAALEASEAVCYKAFE